MLASTLLCTELRRLVFRKSDAPSALAAHEQAAVILAEIRPDHYGAIKRIAKAEGYTIRRLDSSNSDMSESGIYDYLLVRD